MKQYIRTKDKIEKVPNDYANKLVECPNLIIADAIEELCDRYVIIHKYGEQPKEMSFYEAEYFIDVWTRKVKSNDPITAIYGAIWTGKGLIYVAKMNEKGELGLL